MIKVHCFVSCVCESLKKTPGVDQRPFYFGVWDAPFFVTPAHQLAYHREGSDQAFFCTWYERIYGVPIVPWYDHGADKARNIQRLERLLHDRPPHRKVLVMLDLFRLPERENKFQQNPFPHYVMLEHTEDPEAWWMLDPDFRWEGRVPRARVLEAVESPAVAGGHHFDEDRVRPADPDAVEAYFEACFRRDNPFTDAIGNIVRAHVEGRDGLTVAELTRALREIPVLAIRKYAYEHGLAFFWRELGLDRDEFDTLCDDVDELVKAYTGIQYRAVKLATTGDASLADGLFAMLAAQDQRESRIKARLFDAYAQWRVERHDPVLVARARTNPELVP